MLLTRCSFALWFLLLSVLLGFHQGSGYKCPGANSLEGRPANCARIWMGKGHPNKDQGCTGPSFTFDSGFEYHAGRLSVGSVLVRHGCKVDAWHMGHHNGEYHQYTPGLYSLNRYFYLGTAGGAPSISPYGWGSFKCECNLTMGK